MLCLTNGVVSSVGDEQALCVLCVLCVPLAEWAAYAVVLAASRAATKRSGSLVDRYR